MITKIKNIKKGMRDLTVEGVISNRNQPRYVQTRYGAAAVVTAILSDDTGSISLNLWRDQIEKAKDGSTVRITKAFTKDYGESLELSFGKDGEIQIISEEQ
ncbi:DNA-binding protein [Thermoproteota archaeon]